MNDEELNKYRKRAYNEVIDVTKIKARYKTGKTQIVLVDTAGNEYTHSLKKKFTETRK